MKSKRGENLQHRERVQTKNLQSDCEVQELQSPPQQAFQQTHGAHKMIDR